MASAPFRPFDDLLDRDALGDAVCRHLSTAHPTIEVVRYGGGPSSLPLQIGVE